MLPCCLFIAWPFLLTNRSVPRPPSPLSYPIAERATWLCAPPWSLCLRDGAGTVGSPSPASSAGTSPGPGGHRPEDGVLLPGAKRPVIAFIVLQTWGVGGVLKKEPEVTEGVSAGVPSPRDLSS